MSYEDVLRDIIDRLSRVETKVDTLLKVNDRWFDLGVRNWVALIGAGTAIVVALIK